MTSLLSTGKKKAKASRVFGNDLVFDNEASLSYSPSPSKASAIESSIEDSGMVSSENTPLPMVLFTEEHNVETKKRKSVTIVEDKENNKSTKANTDKHNSSFQSIRDAELSRLRAAKSPLRRNLVEKTMEAVSNASSSVIKTLNTPLSKNQSLNSTRQAKKAALRERKQQTKKVRFQWREEKIEAKNFYSKVEEDRRQILALQRQLASAHFQEKANKDASARLQRIAEIDKDSQFNSEVFRDHQKKLKEERDKNRKKSIDARSKLRQNWKEGDERLEARRREEDAAIFEVRHDLHRARLEAAKTNKEKHRQSMEGRFKEAIRIRDTLEQQQNDEQMLVQKSFELKRAAGRDVDEYKKQQAAERRESFKGRGLDARRRHKEVEKLNSQSMKAEHEGYELKWAGENDAKAYEEKMKEERRKSLAARNKESARHAKVMEELRNVAMEQEAESFMLKFAGENDAKDYLKKVAEERRKSLHGRGEESMRRRKWEQEQHDTAVNEALKEGELQSGCHKDVENYKKKQEEKARKSLQFRLKEARLKRLEAENEREKKQALDHKSFKLDSLANMDVDEYLKDCKKRRRKSLAFRAKEKRRHATWAQKQHEKEVRARQESGHLQSLDYQYMALAQQQERARVALDALRSVGCNIKGNPFEGLMKL